MKILDSAAEKTTVLKIARNRLVRHFKKDSNVNECNIHPLK